jgi:hypothetical protein
MQQLPNFTNHYASFNTPGLENLGLYRLICPKYNSLGNIDNTTIISINQNPQLQNFVVVMEFNSPLINLPAPNVPTLPG